MQSIKKHAYVCEECSLIAHSKCRENAPPTCGLRAQLLQYANYSSQPDSPSALDILQQFTPSGSPAFDTSAGDSEMTPPPPTSFKMFGGFRRSRSSLRTDATPSRATSQASQTSSHESVVTQSAQGGVNESGPSTPTTAAANRRRSAPILKSEQYRGFGHKPRPLSMSSDGTPNRSSLRSAATAGGESDELELELSNSSTSHSQAASARSRRVMSVGSISIDEPDHDEEAVMPDVSRPQRFLKSRFSMSAASAAETTSDTRRVSIFAPSTVTGDDYGDDRTTHEDPTTVGRRGGKKRTSKTSSDKEKDGKNCIVQ